MSKKELPYAKGASEPWTPRLILLPVPGHPVLSALREAACQRWEEAMALLDRIRRVKPQRKKSAEVKRLASELAILLSKWDELLDWCFTDGEPLNHQQADTVAESMLRTGWTASEALTFAKSLQSRPRKRPADKRHLAIAALELQLGDAGRFTWRELAKQTYGCRHKEACDCDELLRREAGHVKQFLARMGIPLPVGPRK